MICSWHQPEIIAEPLGSVIFFPNWNIKNIKHAELFQCTFVILLFIFSVNDDFLEEDPNAIRKRSNRNFIEIENFLHKFSTDQREELHRFYDMVLECSNKPIPETIDHGIDSNLFEL